MAIPRFSLRTYLIPALFAEKISFRFVECMTNFDTTKIIISHKDVDICRVEAIQELCTDYCYEVTWFSPIHTVRFYAKYKCFTTLIDDIKTAIKNLENGRGNGKSYSWRNEYQKERDKFDIKDVIFNNPATIVLWADGTKTVVKAENEPFDPEKGLAMAISKRALGNNYSYYDIFKKYVGRYEKKQKKGGK